MKKIISVLLFLVLVGFVVYLFIKDDGNTLQKELSDFAVENSDEINKIFIADTYDNTILLEKKENGNWWVNNKFRARQHSVDLILKTIGKIKVKHPVAVTGIEYRLSKIATKHKKVEIYTGDEKLEKVYYIGGSTKDHQGTYMLLETPEDGRSDIPYVCYLPGFYGYLTPRFFTNEEDWRHTGIFNYNDLDEIATIKLDYHTHPKYSFQVNYGGKSSFELRSLENPVISQPIDTTRMQEFFLQFKKKHYETLDKFNSQVQKDSIRQRKPFLTISVLEKNQSKNSITIWDKRNIEKEKYPDLIYDSERKYAEYNGEMVLIQNFAFGNLFIPIDWLTGKRTYEDWVEMWRK